MKVALNFSCYLLWANDNRERVNAELGGNLSVLEVAQELGRRWPKVDPQTKETYVQRAKEEKAKSSRRRQPGRRRRLGRPRKGA